VKGAAMFCSGVKMRTMASFLRMVFQLKFSGVNSQKQIKMEVAGKTEFEITKQVSKVSKI